MTQNNRDMKNLPNKVYITPNFNRRWFSKEIDDESAEYIRKDALLEWAKEWTKMYPYGFQLLVYKINSL